MIQFSEKILFTLCTSGLNIHQINFIDKWIFFNFGINGINLHEVQLIDKRLIFLHFGTNGLIFFFNLDTPKHRKDNKNRVEINWKLNKKWKRMICIQEMLQYVHRNKSTTIYPTITVHWHCKLGFVF